MWLCALTHIRAGRPRPGLMAQHLAALQAVAVLCRGELTGAALGATDIHFQPGPIAGGEYEFDVGTAGSVSLVLQALLPVALHADGPCKLRVTGGTDVRMAPPVDYLRLVFLPWLERMGARVRIEAGAALDVHAADQLLVYAALARGPSRFAVRKFSRHAQTVLWLIEQFLPARFRLERREGLDRIEVLPPAPGRS